MPRDKGHFEFKWNRPMIKEKEVVNFYALVNLYRGEEEGDGVKQNNGDGNKVTREQRKALLASPGFEL